MTTVPPATETVSFVDASCVPYRDLFGALRSFDHFTRLDFGLISDVAWTSLPAISHLVGTHPQALHHVVANADWAVTHLRQRRLQLTRQALRGRSFEMRQLRAGESARAANQCCSGMSFADGFHGFRCI